MMRLLVALAVTALGLTGCPEDATTAPDATADTVAPDAAQDTLVDTAPDNGKEVGAETSPEVGAETVEDATAEDVNDVDGAAPDAAPEVTTDVAPDEGVTPPGNVFTTSIGDWTMSPGQEQTKCSIRKLNNATKINVSSIRTKLAPGSHHLIVYKVADAPEQTTPFNCTPFVNTLGGNAVPLMITQVAEETLTFPPGVVLELEPNQTLRLEAHYLNYFPSDIVAHADIEFFTTDEQDVQKADFLFYGTTSFSVPPNQEYTTAWKHLDVPNGAKVFAVTGHTHEMGTNVEVTKSTSASDPGTPLYPLDKTFLWDEAPVTYHSPPIEFAPGDGFRFRCTWVNTSNSSIGFGESANKEMCFLWAYYYPSQGFRLCADGLFGCPSDG